VVTVQFGVQILAAVAMTVLRPSSDRSISAATDEQDSDRLAPVRRDSRS
jgi:hypothetical protein